MARMTIERFVEQLRLAFGDDLRSVVLYGSAAAGEAEATSDQNVLVLVDELHPERLQAIGAAVRAWMDAGNPPPFTLTTEEWRRSGDIFPMEYADIIDRHRVLHGDAGFAALAVQPRDLRWQLELEAMGKLLHLRQGLFATAGDRKRQLELLEASKSAVLVLFRATIRLEGRSPARDPIAVCRDAAAIAGFDPAPFERVVRHVRGIEKLKLPDVGPVLDAYVRGVERLVGHLDQHHVGH